MKIKQRGFSIIEVLLAIGILSVVGVIASNLLARTYKTSSDADFLSKLKQNGTVASDILSESIRMADSVVCYEDSNPVKRIVVQTLNGKYLLFRFVDPKENSGKKLIQNGYIAKQEDLDPDNLEIFCSSEPNLTEEAPITDNGNDTGVSISNGSFTRLSGSVGKDTVSIKFDVGPPVGQAGTAGIVNIQTTVQVR